MNLEKFTYLYTNPPYFFPLKISVYPILQQKNPILKQIYNLKRKFNRILSLYSSQNTHYFIDDILIKFFSGKIAPLLIKFTTGLYT